MSRALSTSQLARYASFGVPLGFIGLPLYVHLPKFYADTMPVSLTVIGNIMFFSRLVDCFCDPLIGYVSGAFPAARALLLAVARVMLGVGVCGLFFLPDIGVLNPSFWLAALLVITYLSYSVLTINYYSAGLGIAQDYVQNTRLSVWREAAIIVGVLVASALPPALTPYMGENHAYRAFVYVFLVILLCASQVSQRYFTAPSPAANSHAGLWSGIFSSVPLRWIFALFFINAIAPAITSTLFLFFTADILRAPELSGVFLVVYFISAAAAMPLWLRLNTMLSKRHCLVLSMSLALASFAWTYNLGEHDVLQFALICALSGAALGGDLAILPSLLADAVGRDESGTVQGGSMEFGIWNFISKFTLALAAGITLPLLDSAGHDSEHTTLRLCYALIPCLFKLTSLCVLFISPIDSKRRYP